MQNKTCSVRSSQCPRPAARRRAPASALSPCPSPTTRCSRPSTVITTGVKSRAAECAFCTFPDKHTAAAEFARVLRPGGRVGISDVTVTGDGLPRELTTLAAWAACIAGACPARRYAELLTAAGLQVIRQERHDAAIARMTGQIDARIRLLRMTAAGRLAAAGIDADTVLRYTALARQAVADGMIGYRMLIAEKPGARRVAGASMLAARDVLA
jgi:hypothetical protein